MLKRKGLGLAVVLSVCLAFVLSGCGGAAPTGAQNAKTGAQQKTASGNDQQVIKLKFADYYPPEHYIVKNGVKPWIEQVEKASNGRIKIEYFGAEQMGNARDLLSILQRGVADIASITPAYYEGKMPLSSISGLPGLFSSSVVGSPAFSEAILSTDMLKHDYTANSMYPLWGVYTDTYNVFTTKKTIQAINDLKGMKIKTPGGYYSKSIAALGANPQAIAATETYQALDQGTVEGLIISVTSIPPYNFNEVTKFGTLGFNMGSTWFGFQMNLKKWDSLPDDLKKVIQQANQDTTTKVAKYIDAQVDTLLEQFRKQGIKIINLPDEEQKKLKDLTDPVVKKWVTDMKDKGFDGQKILDDYLKQIKQHSGS